MSFPSSSAGTGPGVRRRHLLRRRAAALRRRARRLDPTLRGLLWTLLAGICFCLLNAGSRTLALEIAPLETMFLRYLIGVVFVVGLSLRAGLHSLKPMSMRGQFTRGLVHTTGLGLWFLGLPHVALADVTALSFTTPIWVMVGAVLFLRERMRPARVLAAAGGVAGMLIVVAPQLSGRGGAYLLLLLAASPLFAASFLITKAQTRYESPQVIVIWQSITVALLSAPLALLHWTWPTASQWGLLVLCGMIGSLGHYSLTQSMKATEISATQSVRFLELIWAAMLGWLLFGDVPTRWTFIGGLVICLAVVWLARRESRTRAPA